MPKFAILISAFSGRRYDSILVAHTYELRCWSLSFVTCSSTSTPKWGSGSLHRYTPSIAVSTMFYASPLSSLSSLLRSPGHSLPIPYLVIICCQVQHSPMSSKFLNYPSTTALAPHRNTPWNRWQLFSWFSSRCLLKTPVVRFQNFFLFRTRLLHHVLQSHDGSRLIASKLIL